MSAFAALQRPSACSIFETAIEIFHNLILEGDHARLCLPPFCASRRFKRRNREPHGAPSKFTIEHPPNTASGKNFGWGLRIRSARPKAGHNRVHGLNDNHGIEPE